MVIESIQIRNYMSNYINRYVNDYKNNQSTMQSNVMAYKNRDDSDDSCT